MNDTPQSIATDNMNEIQALKRESAALRAVLRELCAQSLSVTWNIEHRGEQERWERAYQRAREELEKTEAALAATGKADKGSEAAK